MKSFIRTKKFEEKIVKESSVLGFEEMLLIRGGSAGGENDGTVKD